MFVTFDFETSGLPQGRCNSDARTNLRSYDTCRAVSLSAVRFDDEGQVCGTFNKYIMPDGTFEIHPKSTELHGLTAEKLKQIGEPFSDVYLEFVKFVGPIQTVVAYNANFDINVLRSEIIRNGCSPFDEENYKVVCALKTAKRAPFLKFPFKLQSVYRQLFGKEFDGAHNSLEDSVATGEVYHHITQRNKSPMSFRPIEAKTINIRTSEVPTAIGVGFNTAILELIDEVWKRNSPSTFTGSTRENEALNVIRSDDKFMAIMDDVTTFKVSDGPEVEDKIMSICKQIDDHESDERSKFVTKDYFSNMLRTVKSGGCFSLDDIYTYPITTIKGTLYQIRGKIDNVEVNADGSTTILMTTTRSKGFRNVPDYDVPKYQTYMHMIDAKSLKLTERYNGKQRLHEIERDDAMFMNDILPRLEKFCEYFHSRLSM